MAQAARVLKVPLAQNGFPEGGGAVFEHVAEVPVDFFQNDRAVFDPIRFQQRVKPKTVHAQSVGDHLKPQIFPAVEGENL